ncbi:hypothetical protein Peur_029633 [Populus x canadensis]
MEETHVPLVLDLQVEDVNYIFEAKTIKRMELLDKVNECYKLIIEPSGNQNQCHKCKYLSTPSSPNGVIDASFSSDISNNSWAVASSLSSSSVPQFKRSRAQVQQMQLPSLNCMCVDVLSSPR